jgi:hypothetical protein
MRDVVHAIFPAFSKKFEGCLPWMYLDFHHDAKGNLAPLVTAAIGNLADPVELALEMPWVWPLTGIPCSPDEVRAAWVKVKAATNMAHLGGGAFAGLTAIRLTPAGITQVSSKRLTLIEMALHAGYPAWESYPASVQLAMLSMSWAMGAARIVPSSAFEYPHFRAAVLSGDWATCAGPAGDADRDPACRGQAWMNDNHLPGPNPINPGLHPRNLANRALFQAAAMGGDPDVVTI